MIIRRRFMSLAATSGLLLCAALSTAACSQGVGGSKRYPDYRYRLTVEVDTPDGVRSGSSVIEVSTWVSGEYSLQPGKVSSRVRGEAVTIDLGQRGVMFALLRSEYSVDWAGGALMSATKPVTYDEAKAAGLTPDYNPSFEMGMQRMMALRERHDIPRHVNNVFARAEASRNGGKLPSFYPIMVTFGDIADPKSVTKLDPDNLAVRFGKGVKLKRITVELTTDEVTTGIEKKLVWLSDLKKYQKDPNNIFTSTLPSEIGYLRRK